MKKLILLLIPIILCLGCEAKTESFSKICTIKKDSPTITDTTEKLIIYNNLDEITKAVITRTYTAKNDDGEITISNIKKSAENYNNNLAKSKNIIIKNIKEENDTYVIEYTLDVQKLTDEQLDEFDLKKNSIKLFNKMRNKNIECKKTKSKQI